MIGVPRVRALEAAHARHRHVQNDEREVLLQHLRECLDTRLHHHELAAKWRERGVEGDQVRFVVIDDENVVAAADPQCLFRRQLFRRGGRLRFFIAHDMRT